MLLSVAGCGPGGDGGDQGATGPALTGTQPTVVADISQISLGGILPTGCTVLVDDVLANPGAEGLRWSVSIPASRTTRFLTIALCRDADHPNLPSRSLRPAQQPVTP